MRLLLAALPVIAGSTDPCNDLCDFDGPDVCTHGSTADFDVMGHEICTGYYYIGNPERAEYAYSADAALSPMPVPVADVPRLIALSEAPSILHRMVEQTMTTRELAEHLSSLENVSMEQVGLLVQALERELHTVNDSRDAIEWWVLLGGPAIRRLSVDLNRRNMQFVRPLVMIATNLNVAVGEEVEFAQETGFFEFCSEFGPRVQKFLSVIMRKYHSSQRLENEAAGRLQLEDILWTSRNLYKYCPFLFDDLTMKSALIAQNFAAGALHGASPRYQYIMDDINPETAFTQVLSILNGSRVSLCNGLGPITIRGETVDNNTHGSQRMWAVYAAREIAASGLFIKKNNLMLVNPQAGDLVSDCESKFHAVGRFLAISLIMQLPVAINLPVAVYAAMLGEKLSVHDMVIDEPELHALLTDVVLARSDEELQGFTIDIIGEATEVTMENRQDLVERKLGSLIDPAAEPFLRIMGQGFLSLIPAATLAELPMIDLQDIRALVFGSSLFRVDDFMAHAQLLGYDPSDPQIQWLAEALGEFSESDWRGLLYMTTGTTQTPHGGFSNLISPIVIARVNPSRHHTPTARSGNEFILSLPAYRDASTLKVRLGTAVAAAALDAGLSIDS